MNEEELETIDDLLPLDGEPFQMPVDEEVKAEENEESSMIKGAGSQLINEILAWFDGEIVDAETISNLDIQSKVPLDAQVMALKLLSTKLQRARANLASTMEAHLRDQE